MQGVVGVPRSMRVLLHSPCMCSVLTSPMRASPLTVPDYTTMLLSFLRFAPLLHDQGLILHNNLLNCNLVRHTCRAL